MSSDEFMNHLLATIKDLEQANPIKDAYSSGYRFQVGQSGQELVFDKATGALTWQTLPPPPPPGASNPNPVVKKYVYPDGHTNIFRPADGQTFIEWGPNQNPIKNWIWNDFKEQWIDITIYINPNSGSNWARGANQELEDNIAKEFEHLISEISECECGSDKIGSSKHSNWCKKYSE